MLDHDDLKWIATTSTELNSMLQQISRYADLARQHKGEYNYIEMLGERVEFASRTAQALFDRVTSSILDAQPRRAPAKPAAPISVLPPPTEFLPQLAAARTSGMATVSPRPEPTPITMATATPLDLRVINPQGARENILLIDDEVEVAELAAEMLGEEGYRVILAKDGFEALRIYQQLGSKIGLVILDFFLPIMDGDAVFDELRAANPSVDVVLSSGFAEQSKLGAMLAQGLRGFIPKPYTRQKLLEQVRLILDTPRQKFA
ncbi:MAG TPA: response regulator [Chthoniobacterales bacterium]|nr:response regulator [Chthoniobacterales bacterium]